MAHSFALTRSCSLGLSFALGSAALLSTACSEETSGSPYPPFDAGLPTASTTASASTTATASMSTTMPSVTMMPTMPMPTMMPTMPSMMPSMPLPSVMPTASVPPMASGGAGGMPPVPSASGGSDTGGTGNLQDAGPGGGTALDASTDIDLPELDAGDAGDAGDAAVAVLDASTGADASVDASLDAATPVLDASPDEPADSGPAAQDAAVTDAGSDPDPEPAEGEAEVACSWTGAGASTYYFSVSLLLTNTSDEVLDLRDVEMLYYFSADGREATQSVVVNDSPVGAMGDTEASIEVTGANPPAGADHYVLISFADCTTGCTLAAGASLARAVQIGLGSGASGAFNATNDYSYTPTDDDPCEFVVVLQNSTRIFGTPPN